MLNKAQYDVINPGKAAVDEGLRNYMLNIYNYMAGALAFNGALAYLIYSTPALFNALAPNAMIFGFIAMGISLFAGFKITSIKPGTAQILFWSYAGSLAVITSVYLAAFEPTSVIRAFFQTAAVFAGMSLYGYTTKKDLSGIGSFLMVGLIGVLLGSLVNLFLKSSGFGFALSAIFTVIMVGLIAYDTQKLRNMYYQVPAGEMRDKLAIMGALNLFADFLFLFFQLLQFFGDRR